MYDCEPNIFLQGITVGLFYGRRKAAGIRGRMMVIEEIPASSSDADTRDEDEEVIFRSSEIESVSEDDSTEEEEENGMDQKSKRAKGFR